MRCSFETPASCFFHDRMVTKWWLVRKKKINFVFQHFLSPGVIYGWLLCFYSFQVRNKDARLGFHTKFDWRIGARSRVLFCPECPRYLQRRPVRVECPPWINEKARRRWCSDEVKLTEFETRFISHGQLTEVWPPKFIAKNPKALQNRSTRETRFNYFSYIFLANTFLPGK